MTNLKNNNIIQFPYKELLAKKDAKEVRKLLEEDAKKREKEKDSFYNSDGIYLTDEEIYEDLTEEEIAHLTFSPELFKRPQEKPQDTSSCSYKPRTAFPRGYVCPTTIRDKNGCVTSYGVLIDMATNKNQFHSVLSSHKDYKEYLLDKDSSNKGKIHSNQSNVPSIYKGTVKEPITYDMGLLNF